MAALLATACSADVTGSGTELIAAVDEDAVTTQLLYMHDIAALPLTESDLVDLGIDVADATPVRVEVYDGVAAAFFAPDGVALYGRDNIVALWDVLDRQTIADETHNPGSTPVVNPNIGTVGQYNLQDEIGIRPDVVATPDTTGATIINWYNRVGGAEELRLLQRLERGHPGCS
ncbi:MAG: hypothetical protein AB7S26_14910 [Sandaracinaceae bacterium]